mmetsp:Transcript_4719/g.9477  ORF Transcript_4719/g.9477 Transcript_4719/m.9477 type:complete len:221 (-) Transcript_4719:2025-2687(-)
MDDLDDLLLDFPSPLEKLLVNLCVLFIEDDGLVNALHSDGVVWRCVAATSRLEATCVEGRALQNQRVFASSRRTLHRRSSFRPHELALQAHPLLFCLLLHFHLPPPLGLLACVFLLTETSLGPPQTFPHFFVHVADLHLGVHVQRGCFQRAVTDVASSYLNKLVRHVGHLVCHPISVPGFYRKHRRSLGHPVHLAVGISRLSVDLTPSEVSGELERIMHV